MCSVVHSTDMDGALWSSAVQCALKYYRAAQCSVHYSTIEERSAVCTIEQCFVHSERQCSQ